MKKIPGRAVTPLWIVAAFLTLTEVILGYAVIQVHDRPIQIALTSFVITFAILVTIAFFVILWNRPYVFYPPSEYPNSDPTRFVEAISRGMNNIEFNLEQLGEQVNRAGTRIVDDAILDEVVAPDEVRKQIKTAVSNQMELLKEHVVKIQEVAGEIKDEFIGREQLREKVLELLERTDYYPMTSYGIANKLRLGVPEVKHTLETLITEGLVTTKYAGRFTVYALASESKRRGSA